MKSANDENCIFTEKIYSGFHYLGMFFKKKYFNTVF